MDVSVFTIGYYTSNVSLAGCSLAVVSNYVIIAKLLTSLCHFSCSIVTLHPPSYNIARCGFCVIKWHLSDDGVSFTTCECLYPLI